MENKLYSIDEVKDAFWKTFFKSGEWWFNYFSDLTSDEDCNGDVEHAWKEFIENLSGKQRET